jgi:two-component system, NtrC family, response regulator HydG
VRRILLVDDDPQALDSTRKILEFSGFEVVAVGDGQAALDRMRPSTSPRFDVVVSDVRMPRLGGLEFLRALSLCGETTPVILMTAFGRVEDAVWAMKLGAVDFLTKPFKRQQLVDSVEMALKRVRARGAEHPEKAGRESVGALLGDSPRMRELREMIAQVGPTTATVLVTGESGTGKELVARRLHRQGPRKDAPFIALNCGAVPENLIESELYGFEKGAFTGATSARMGLFEAAHGGSLLLDEIGDMPVPLQASLLRSLQEGEVRRLGSTLPKKVDVRLIAATHRNLADRVSEGRFRQDLLYRLEVITIVVPPLRERVEDIPALAAHFVASAAARHAKTVGQISEETLECLRQHAWPGNVRELSNVIERAVVFAQGDRLELQDLPPHLAQLAGRPSSRDASAPTTIAVPLGVSLREVEELLIRKTLEATDGDKNMTAKLLGINSRTIYRKLDRRGEKDPVEPG